MTKEDGQRQDPRRQQRLPLFGFGPGTASLERVSGWSGMAGGLRGPLSYKPSSTISFVAARVGGGAGLVQCSAVRAGTTDSH